MFPAHSMTMLRFSAALALLLSISAVVSAQERTLTGTYRLAPDAQQVVDKAIDKAAAQFNFLIRPVARSRLKKTNPVHDRLVIEQTDRDISVTFDHDKPIRTVANDGPIKWTRDDGEVFDLATQLRQGVLMHTFVASDGRRVNSYSLSPDGRTLTLQVTLTSEQLKSPVEYSLVYWREDER